VVLRLLILKQIRNWSNGVLEHVSKFGNPSLRAKRRLDFTQAVENYYPICTTIPVRDAQGETVPTATGRVNETSVAEIMLWSPLVKTRHNARQDRLAGNEGFDVAPELRQIFGRRGCGIAL